MRDSDTDLILLFTEQNEQSCTPKKHVASFLTKVKGCK